MKPIGYQGVPGAFSEQAALGVFGARAKTRPFADFESVFKAVRSGALSAGVLPIENSLAGSIHQNYDLLRSYDVWIRGEYKLRVRHNLLALPGVKVKDVRRVLSHPQALSQCAAHLKAMRGVELVPYFDTAGAARHLEESGARDAAAIASARAAENYGLAVLRAGIEDDHTNFTRFLVVEKRRRGAEAQKTPRGKTFKTSLVFSLRNIPGAMHKGLAIFALRDIDLFKIESRPLAGSPWQYLFYLDLAGSAGDEPVQRALSHLGEISTYLKLLGSYPQAN